MRDGCGKPPGHEYWGRRGVFDKTTTNRYLRRKARQENHDEAE